jgi:hypothetical protein
MAVKTFHVRKKQIYLHPSRLVRMPNYTCRSPFLVCTGPGQTTLKVSFREKTLLLLADTTINLLLVEGISPILYYFVQGIGTGTKQPEPCDAVGVVNCIILVICNLPFAINSLENIVCLSVSWTNLMPPKRKTPFHQAQLISYDLKICERDASTKVVVSVACQFGVHFGREEKVGAKRKATTHIQCCRSPFRADVYSRHMLAQHSVHWQQP